MSDYPSYLGGNVNPGSTSGGPDMLGGGMYTPQALNQAAFGNPLAGAAVPAANQEIGNYLGATTPGVTAASSGAYGAGLAGQQQLAGQLQQMAAGQGPSAATVAAQQQGATNLQGAESMLGSARGAGNPAQAQLAAQNARAQGAQQVAGNVVAGRTQEELGALGAAGGLYGNMAGEGLQQQQQQNQIAQGNQQNLLQAHTNFLGAVSGIGGQQQQGQIAGQQAALGQQQLASGAYSDAANRGNKIFGQVLGAGTSAAGALSVM